MVQDLLIARAALRSKEVGVRMALGGGRARIVSLFFAEALALSAVGAVAGLGVAWAGLRFFNAAFAAAEVAAPISFVFRLDGASLLFAVGVTALSAVVAGCLPAIQTQFRRPSGTESDPLLRSCSLVFSCDIPGVLLNHNQVRSGCKDSLTTSTILVVICSSST